MNPLTQAPARRAGVELRRPARLVDHEGSTEARSLTADAHTALWCRVVLGGQEGLIEVVRATRAGDGGLRMRSRRDPAGYLEAWRAHAVVALVARARGRGEEVFATPVPKTSAEPGRSSAAAGRIVWVDVDEPDPAALRRVEALRPHLLVDSGGGLHAYWRLAQAVAPDELEALNRRLCSLVDGDAACTDRGRIMRIAGTFNGRRRRWCRVLEADRSRPWVDPSQLAARVPDPDPPPRPTPPSRRRSGEPDDELALIAPPAYFRALCGVEVDERGGDIRCPLPGHDDRYASLHVYGEPGRGWWCFGCNRGGGIYDLASLINGGPWGRDLRGEQFVAAKESARAAAAA